MLDIFKSLSDETRLRIVNVLLTASQELCVCDLMQIFKLHQYSISRHMKELISSKLITSKRKGKFIYYHINQSLSKHNPFLKQVILAQNLYPDDIQALKQRILEKKTIQHCI